MAVVVCVAGDVMLDVHVATEGPLRPDDDIPASITLSAGGQAANVAAWVAELGGEARLFGGRARDVVGTVLGEQLQQRGISLFGEQRYERSGTVVSLVTGGTRTLASDPGHLTWIEEGLADPAWLTGAGWLLLSGYLLLRADDPGLLVRVAEVAHAHGTRVAVDLASAAMIETYGPAPFWRLVRDLRPHVVLGNEAEWTMVGADPLALPIAAVVKRGPAGATFVEGGRSLTLPAVHGPVVDVTGGGDALAAGYLIGGPGVAMDTAARCVALIGAQPALPPSAWALP